MARILAEVPQHLARVARGLRHRRLLEVDVSRAAWLVRDGEVLASLVVADSYASRAKGLLGKESLEGALLITRTASVHTIGMRIRIDIAFLDAKGEVGAVLQDVAPWRITRRRRSACAVLEAEAGAFARWNLAKGDFLEFK